MKNLCSKCNNFLDENRIGKQRYCKSCHAENMRLNRPSHSQLTDDQKIKANARSYAKVYLKRGKLIKQSCQVCNDPDTEMHHPDYSKPLEIIWLCRIHHLQIHS